MEHNARWAINEYIKLADLYKGNIIIIRLLKFQNNKNQKFKIFKNK